MIFGCIMLSMHIDDPSQFTACHFIEWSPTNARNQLRPQVTRKRSIIILRVSPTSWIATTKSSYTLSKETRQNCCTYRWFLVMHLTSANSSRRFVPVDRKTTHIHNSSHQSCYLSTRACGAVLLLLLRRMLLPASQRERIILIRRQISQ